jgi:hypothetical protein
MPFASLRRTSVCCGKTALPDRPVTGACRFPSFEASAFIFGVSLGVILFPFPYPLLIGIALIPFLWRRMMDPRVEAAKVASRNFLAS